MSIHKSAQLFRDSWEKAGRDGSVSLELAQALQEEFGIHPDRAQAYMDDLMAFLIGRGSAERPNPEDYREPVVVKFPCKSL